MTQKIDPKNQELIPNSILQKVCAEMIGTFALVFVGCGAIMVDKIAPGHIGHIGIALCFGFTIMVMIYATGHISGAHFNPAVTLAFALIGQLDKGFVLPYIAGQLFSASVAAFLLKASLGGFASIGATVPTLSFALTFLFEFLLTMLLMFVIASMAIDKRAEGHMGGLTVGATVIFCALFAGPLTGASMNPARSLGPAIASGQFSGLWLYLLAPILGAIAGACASSYLSDFKEKK